MKKKCIQDVMHYGIKTKTWKIMRLIAIFLMLIISQTWASQEAFAGETIFQQQKSIVGRVSDNTGQPLPGVTVVVKGTLQGTITNANGEYTLVNVPENAILVFSFVGMLTQEVGVGNQTTVNITLEQGTIGMEEVVVVGYGTMRRSDLTGAVGSVGGTALQDVKVTNVEQALLGKVPGVQIKPRDGAPGAPPQIIIRGVGSITAGTNPLYIVDGFPVADLQTLSLDNIESIDVLKDASATAIYGSRGSNGVVILTTKRGQAGKPVISFNTSMGLQSISQKPHFMNAKEQAEYGYWAVYFRNIDDGNSVSGPPETWSFRVPQTILDVLAGTNTTDVDWVDEIMQVAPIANYHLSISGGNENVKYAVSGEYLDQDGIIINSNFKRYSLQANVDAQLTKRLAFKISLNPSYNEDTGADPRGTASGSGILGPATAINAFIPVYQENGDYFVINGLPEVGNNRNPVAALNEVVDNSKNARFQGNMVAEYALLEELKFNIMLGGSFIGSKGMSFTPMLPSLRTSVASGSDNASLGINWVSEYTLNYRKSFGEHHFVGLAGFTSEKNRIETNSLSSVSYPNNLVPYLSAVKGLLSGGTSELSEWSLISYLARVNYNYKDTYYATASFRTDGSSRFGSAKKYGNFPSVALAWRVSNESFLRNSKVLSNLKIRASFGKTGNNNIGNYEALPTIQNVLYPWGNKAIGGFIQQRIANPDLTWESQSSRNIGLDASFFSNRVNLTIDNFNTRNKSLLLNVNIPTITGYSTALQNIGEVENKGWDFSLNTINLQGKFEWTTDFNISFYKNKVLSLGTEDDPIIIDRHITMVGQPIGMFYGLVYDGIFETSAELDEGPLFNPGARNGTHLGDAKFIDYSGPDGVPDGIINSYDRVIMGSPYPDFYYGMTNRFSYQGFTLSISLQGVNGNEIISRAKTVGLRSEYRVKQLAMANNFWISEEQPGDGNTPRPNDEPTGGIREVSTRHLNDGSYLRINNISLSYELPSNIIQSLRINSIRIYLNATNPFIFSNTDGFNPDVSDSDNPLAPGEDYNNYPLPKSLSLGLNLVF
jgi:TonB-linked SusC/RagA family outer membrane protein